MRETLSGINWRTELDSKPATEAWEFLKQAIRRTTAELVPLRRMRNNNRPGWLNQEILRAIRRKKRLWGRVKRGEAVQDYEQEERRVRNLIRNAKRKFERKLADGAGGDGVAKRKFFAYVRQRTKTRPSIGPLKNEAGVTVREDGEMAEIFNSFFSSVFTRENITAVPAPAEQHQGANLTHVSITTKKVKMAIKRLKKGSAAGPDEIGPQLLQELVEVLASPLATIMRKSLEEGSVPDDWRAANVAPIFKKGAKSSPGNYRPVSLTSVCCRIMETIIKDDIVQHLERSGLINATQHGFMRGKSCASNLLCFLEKVTAAVDSGEAVDVVFLDFAKAFDKVPVQRLLKKVKAHGIHGKLYDWIAAWLQERVQRVVLNGQSSTWAAVLSGVPQGSVLGPLLFLIFINDLDSAATAINILLKFADDTKVAQPLRSDADRAALQEALNSLTEWADRWGMAFNVQKCKVMHVGRNNPRHEYSMAGTILSETVDERLGRCHVQNTETLSPMLQGGKNGLGCTRPDYQGLSLQRQACICEAIQAVCTPTSGIFSPGMVPLDSGRQGHPGERTEAHGPPGVGPGLPDI